MSGKYTLHSLLNVSSFPDFDDTDGEVSSRSWPWVSQGGMCDVNRADCVPSDMNPVEHIGLKPLPNTKFKETARRVC